MLYQKTETGVSALGMLSLCNSPLCRSSSPQTQVVGVADSRGSVNISSWDYDPQVEGVLSCPLPGIMVVQLLTQHQSPWEDNPELPAGGGGHLDGNATCGWDKEGSVPAGQLGL